MFRKLQNGLHEQAENGQLLIDDVSDIPDVTLSSKVLEELLLDYIVKYGLTANANKCLRRNGIVHDLQRYE